MGVTEVTYYRGRAEYGGLKGDQVKRLKELEAENARLRRAVSDLTLDKMILAEAPKGNFGAPRAILLLRVPRIDLHQLVLRVLQEFVSGPWDYVSSLAKFSQ